MSLDGVHRGHARDREGSDLGGMVLPAGEDLSLKLPLLRGVWTDGEWEAKIIVTELQRRKVRIGKED